MNERMEPLGGMGIDTTEKFETMPAGRGEEETTHGADVALGTIFLHDVTKVDCALFDPSKGVYGQTWKVDITLTGPLGPTGFVYDFSHLKRLARQVLKSSIDHALVIPINSQSVLFRGQNRGECWSMRSRGTPKGGESQWSYTSPAGSVFPSRTVALNRLALEQEVARSLRHRLPPEVTNVAVALREEEADPTEAVVRYTHGIAKHEGLCQRLFHGHRCRIQVFVGDERRPDLEHYLARDVLGSHVHIATPSQFKSGHIEAGTRGQGKDPVTLAYEGSMGYFEATLPADRVFVVSRETSVECIARELARLVKREENTGDKVRVICYEGIGKGAIAEA